MSNYFIFIVPPTKERECTKMCRAILISEVIINRCIDNGYLLNTSKLQKLLYYMQKKHLEKYGIPMFDENILAWECGPAIPEIHEYFKEGCIRFDPQKRYTERITLLETHDMVINEILQEYGDMSPMDMVKKSRLEQCWIDTWNDGKGIDSIIHNILS